MNQKYILSANNNSLIEEIHNTVQSIGYCIVRGLNLNHLDGSRRNKKLFDFLSQLGMRNRFTWCFSTLENRSL
ncbi:hypothetical protein FGF63_09590 [Neisseria meningitidis]|nr:hypothetical protein [Neisseria meningitidis]